MGLFDEIIKRGIGKVAKSVAEDVGKKVSSSAEVLVGKTIGGKVVKAVTKGEQNWRYVVYEDGTKQPFKKDVISSMCRRFGTEEYVGKLEGKSEPEQLQQALKSLQFHTDRQKDFTTQAMRDDYQRLYNAQMKQLGLPDSKMIHIDDPVKAYIPQEYADILEQAGAIKINPRKQKVE